MAASHRRRRPARYGITTRLTRIFVAFAAGLLAVVGGLTFITRRTVLERSAEAELLAVAAEKRAAVESWAGERQQDIAELAVSPAISNLLERYIAADVVTALAAGRLPADLRGEGQAAHDELVRELFAHLAPRQTFEALFVLEPGGGQVIAATDPSLEGLFKENRPFFVNGKERPYFQNPYYALSAAGPQMMASAPIRAADGRLLGVLAGQLNMAPMEAIVNRRTPLRETLDAYLVNEVRLFITQPRLAAGPTVFLPGVNDALINNCQASGSGVMVTTDRQGRAIISAYQWLPARRLCLIVTIDQAEIFASLREQTLTLLLIGAAGLAAASVVAGHIARSFTRPVLALQTKAAHFGRGELVEPLPAGADDELGDLAREFNLMAAALDAQKARLRDYAAGLEAQVQQRTAELAESERRFRTLVELAPVGIFESDAAGRCLFVNEHWCQITGLSAERALGDGWTLALHPDSRARAVAQWQALVSSSERYMDELCWRHEGGAVRWSIAQATVICDAEGRTTGFMGTLTDITAAKRAEQALRDREGQLESALERQAVLLQEIHHRVKNNLQVVTSLLRLQSRRVSDPRVVTALSESQQRVAVMALVHELLYQSSDLMSIDAQVYFERLSNQLVHLYGLDRQRTRVIIGGDGQHLSLEQAVPCGLLVHELLTNSFKYAFPDQRQGTITVDLREVEPGVLQLQVADTGVGLPDPLPRERSLGMQLIDGFARQLRGRLVWSEGPGASATVRFPAEGAALLAAPALAERIQL